MIYLSLGAFILGLAVGLVTVAFVNVENRYKRAVLKLWRKNQSLKLKLYYSESEKDLLASMLVRHQIALDIENKVAYKADQRQSLETMEFSDQQEQIRRKGFRKG